MSNQKNFPNILERFNKKARNYIPLHAGGSFVLGQEQDGQPFGGLFDVDQGFSGRVSQFELWDVALTPDEISEIADCSKESLRPENRIVTWGSDTWIGIETEFLDEPLEDFCKKNVLSETLFWPKKISQEKFLRFCDINQGLLPTLNKNSQSKGIHFEKTEKFIALNKTYPGHEKCLLSESSSLFWYGIRRNVTVRIRIQMYLIISKLFHEILLQKKMWYNPKDLSQDFSMFVLEPPGPAETCAYDFEGNPFTSSCGNNYPCGICDIPEDQLIYMKGLCKDDIASLYDVQYYVYGVHDERPRFK